MSLDFEDMDRYLLAQNSRVIHQVWFGLIPSRREAKKAYEKLKTYRDSWKIKNPTWFHIEWNKPLCWELIKKIYPEHMDMFKKYKYEIQRCDAIRYLILHRYGGWYVDMDYYCNRPLDEAMAEYTNDIYLVQTPNTTAFQDKEHISNSLMYSVKNHPFWKQAMLELEKSQKTPYYYTKHLMVMFTTGPGIMNRVFSMYKYKYKLKSLPWKYFHPYGIKDDIRSTNLSSEIFAAHISKGSWSGNDTFFLNIMFREWWVFLLILLLFIPIVITSIIRFRSRGNLNSTTNS
jgi:mannosyltransferase OCH1-like enzyme